MGWQKREQAYENVNGQETNHKTETESELGALVLDLPTHLLCDIVSRLPLEAIFRCRCVSKDFLKLLTDPYFAELHLTKTPTSDYSLIIQDQFNAPDLFLAHCDLDSCTCVMLNVPESVSQLDSTITTLVGSCNGLLCIRYRSTYYVCNPLLGEFMALPDDTPSNFQPSTFGFCPKTKQYKVIRFASSLCCKIQTLGTGNWRTIDNVPHPKTRASIDSSLNGNFHWITNSETASNLICSFNLETEKFLYMSSPTHFNRDVIERIRHISVGALGGLFSISYVLDLAQFEIWVMKDYDVKESWTKKISIDMKSEDIFQSNSLNRPMMVLNNGDLLLQCSKTGSLVSYNPEKRESEKIMDVGLNFWSGIVHLPSFLSLKSYAAEENVEVVQREKTVFQWKQMPKETLWILQIKNGELIG